MASPSHKPKYLLWGLVIASIILLFISAFRGGYLQFSSSDEGGTAFWIVGLLIIPCIMQVSIAIYRN